MGKEEPRSAELIQAPVQPTTQQDDAPFRPPRWIADQLGFVLAQLNLDKMRVRFWLPLTGQREQIILWLVPSLGR